MADLGTVDLLVVGGGVNGAGIARDAVGRGLSVVLCEKGDLAEGTSSRSGKLVHGGLRYLEHYEFRLVREALIEREVLLEAAPHIIWPMRFVLPHSLEQRPAWMLWLGLFLYDHLGGRKRLPGCRRINLRVAPEGHIIRDEFRLAFEYSDCWVDDARLVVLNALDARQRGATVLTRTTARSARRVDGLWEIDLGEDGNAAGASYRLRARAIVNAAGPWVENVIGQVARLNSRRRVRLVKGSHIVVKKFWDGPQAYLFQNNDKRVIFVNPYEDDLCLIGTTDVAYAGAAEDVAIDDAEIDYLLAAVNRYVTHELKRADVQYAYSGVRPLYDDNAASPSAVTRDYVFDKDEGAGRAPLLSVFGGKITTYRKLAEHAMAELGGVFPRMGGAWTARAPLPGGDLPDSDFSRFLAAIRQRHSWLPAPLAQHYARLYGTRIDAVLGSANSLADLGRHFGGLLYEQEARYLREIEWAQTADDILLRRTKHGLHLDQAARDDFANWLQAA
jgi:D-erythritol 1-phosphate dehydrogenase